MSKNNQKRKGNNIFAFSNNDQQNSRVSMSTNLTNFTHQQSNSSYLRADSNLQPQAMQPFVVAPFDPSQSESAQIFQQVPSQASIAQSQQQPQSATQQNMTSTINIEARQDQLMSQIMTQNQLYQNAVQTQASLYQKPQTTPKKRRRSKEQMQQSLQQQQVRDSSNTAILEATAIDIDTMMVDEDGAPIDLTNDDQPPQINTEPVDYTIKPFSSQQRESSSKQEQQQVQDTNQETTMPIDVNAQLQQIASQTVIDLQAEANACYVIATKAKVQDQMSSKLATIQDAIINQMKFLPRAKQKEAKRQAANQKKKRPDEINGCYKRSHFNVAQQINLGKNKDKADKGRIQVENLSQEEDCKTDELMSSNADCSEKFIVTNVVRDKGISGMLTDGQVTYSGQAHMEHHGLELQRAYQKITRYGTQQGKHPLNPNQKLSLGKSIGIKQKARIVHAGLAKRPRTEKLGDSDIEEQPGDDEQATKEIGRYDDGDSIAEPVLHNDDDMSAEEEERKDIKERLQQERAKQLEGVEQIDPQNVKSARFLEETKLKKDKDRKRQKKQKDKLAYQKKQKRSNLVSKTYREESDSEAEKSSSSDFGDQLICEGIAVDHKIREQVETKPKPDRQKKKHVPDDIFDWNEITPYFRRLRHNEVGVLKLEQDYGLGVIKKIVRGDKPRTMVEELLEQIQNVPIQPSSDLSQEIIDMIDNPESTSESMLRTISVAMKNLDDKDQSGITQIWKFKEPDQSGKLGDAICMDSTKGSPTDRGSNELLKEQQVAMAQDSVIVNHTETKQTKANFSRNGTDLNMQHEQLSEQLKGNVEGVEVTDEFVYLSVAKFDQLTGKAKKSKPTEQPDAQILQARDPSDEECKKSQINIAKQPVPLDLTIHQLEKMLSQKDLSQGGQEMIKIDALQAEIDHAEKNKETVENPDDSKGLELQDILYVGQKDYEQFIEPWNSCQFEALKKFKEKNLTYTELDHELLALTMLTEKVSQQNKDTLHKRMRRNYSDYQDEIFEFEHKMDDLCSRQNFALLYNVPKYESAAVRQGIDTMKNGNPFYSLETEYNINANSDDFSFYQIEDLNKRASRRSQAIWVFESLLRTYRNSAKQLFPSLPGQQYLPELNLWIDRGLTIDDMIIDEAENGCQICFTREAQNYNPVMYCKICKSGVHARCFGDDFIDEIDKTWCCHRCREAKFYYKEAKVVHSLEKQKGQSKKREHAIKLAKKKERFREKKLDKIKCYLCQMNGGFMRYQKRAINSETQSNWYHPFCVMTNPFYCWRKLVLMQEVIHVNGQINSSYKDGKSSARKETENETCKICNLSDPRKYNLLVKCYNCHQNPKGRGTQYFHPMCAWLRGDKFEFAIQSQYDEKDNTLDNKVNTLAFTNSFYKDAFQLEVQIKCEFCLDRDLKTAQLREQKFKIHQTMQDNVKQDKCPWLFDFTDQENQPIRMTEQVQQIQHSQQDSDKGESIIDDKSVTTLPVTTIQDTQAAQITSQIADAMVIKNL